MGGKISTLSVDEERDKMVEGFAKSIFKHYEWQTLKVFSNKYMIKQRDLVVMFRSFLSADDVYLRDFRVKTVDVKIRFMEHSLLLQELVDTFVPNIFSAKFAGLDPPHSPEEISFTRFAVTSYIFCSLQIPDLIFEFFSTLRQKKNLQTSAVFFFFNLEQLLIFLTEDYKSSAALRTVLKCVGQVAKDKEITLLSIMKYGIKYPIMFYILERFRKHMMRNIYGDKFWEGRKRFRLKTDTVDILDHISLEEITLRYENEAVATRMTAISILTDVIKATTDKVFKLNDSLIEHITVLDESSILLMKETLGYKLSRQLITESQLPLTKTPLFYITCDHLLNVPDVDPDITSIINSKNSAKIEHSKMSRCDSNSDLSSDDEEEDENQNGLLRLGLGSAKVPSYRDHESSSLVYSEASGVSSRKQSSIPSASPSNKNTMNRQQSSVHTLSRQESVSGGGNVSIKQAPANNMSSSAKQSPVMSRQPSLLDRQLSALNSKQPSGTMDRQSSVVLSRQQSMHSKHSSQEGSELSDLEKQLGVSEKKRVSVTAQARKIEASFKNRKPGSPQHIEVEETPPPVVNTDDFKVNGCEIILDKRRDRYFKYDPVSGKSSWSQLYYNVHGEVVRQVFH